MLFGRAGEELDALRTAGIEAEIVPGISVAFAAAAALETSLTDRRKAARLVFSTGHRASGGEEGTTHVVYMPGPDYGPVIKRLLREGFTSETPCAVVSAVSLETQSVVRCTLGELPNMGPAPSPSILLVGEVLGQNTVQPHERTRRNWQPRFSHQYGD
jgi:uroporphyrin-III C-methyltransferase